MICSQDGLLPCFLLKYLKNICKILFWLCLKRTPCRGTVLTMINFNLTNLLVAKGSQKPRPELRSLINCNYSTKELATRVRSDKPTLEVVS